MPVPPNTRVRGSIAAGYVVGRSAGGHGPQQLVDLTALGQQMAALGVVPSPGAPSSLAVIADQRFLGNGSGSTAVPVALSITQPAAGLTVAWAIGGITLALANDLAGVEGLATNGLAARTGTSAWTTRTLTPPAAGITVSNGDGVSGNPTLVLANDLAALEAMSGTGLVARIASETYSQRTITGVLNRITITDGGGVAANPQIDISTSYVGQATITTLGTVATGTWQATKIGLAYGGTNADLSATGGANQFLKQSSSGAAITVGQPTFADIASGSTAATATGLTISGGTLSGTTTLTGMTTGSVLFSGASSALAQDNTNLFWDDTNNWLGIGIATPAAKLHTLGTATVDSYVNVGAKIAAGGAGGAVLIGCITGNTSFLASNSASNGLWFYTNNNTLPTAILTNGNVLALQGLTSSFPGSTRSGTEWQHRLADDSAFGPAAASVLAQVGGENGNRAEIKSLTELTTIAAAATTDTTINIPAGAIVIAVSVRVTVAIPTAATFDYGIAGATTRYGAAVSVALNTTSTGTIDALRYYAAATAIRITPNVTPGTNVGRVRTTIHYILVTPPTS